MSCNPSTVNLMNKLSTILKTSLSLGTLYSANSLANILLTHLKFSKSVSFILSVKSSMFR